jgi:hypothetical protein
VIFFLGFAEVVGERPWFSFRRDVGMEIKSARLRLEFRPG